MNVLLRFVAFGRLRSDRNRRTRGYTLAALVFCALGLSMTAGNAAQSPSVTFVARTGDNGNGFIDRMTLTFNTAMNRNVPIKVSTGDGDPGVRVEGYNVIDVRWDSTASNVAILTLEERASADTGARPVVHYDGPEGGAIAAATQLEADDASITSTDGAGPVLLGFGTRDRGAMNLFNSTNEEVVLTFSEPATLSGASKSDRWVALESAIQFINNGGGCPSDGTGTPSTFNFPQPNATTPSGPDGIEVPAPGAFATDWRVIFKSGTLAPNALFVGVGPSCVVGVASTTSVLDQAGNTARSQNEPTTGAGRRAITPVDTRLTSARTSDADGNGRIEAVELTFDQAMDDSTISANLSRLAVKVGDEPVEIAAFDTGAVADDATVRFALTIPVDVASHTGVEPRLTYTKPADCTSSGGSGIKSKVPTAGYRACVASIDVAVADAAGPVLLGSSTSDLDGDGKLDALRMTFSEAIVAPGQADRWRVDGRAPTAVTIDGNDARVVTLTLTEGSSGDTGTLPAITYAAHATNGMFDVRANQITTTTATATQDGAAPRIVAAKQYDTDGNGSIDRAVLTYSEPVEDGTVSPAAFSAGGQSGTAAADHPGDDDPAVADDAIVSVAFGGSIGTAPTQVEYAPSGTGVSDAAANASGAQTVAPAAVVDAAAPLGTVQISPTAPLGTGTSTVRVTYTEPMDVAVTPAGTLGGKALTPKTGAGHTNGWRNDDTRIWEATVEVAAGDCTNSTGCAVTADVGGARDVRSNAQGAVASLATEIDTMAPTATTIGSFTATFASGKSAPQNVLNMFATGFAVTADVVAGEAENGTAEVLLDGEPLATPARDTSIDGDDTSVSATASFADPEALQAAIAEGSHALTVRVCDDAANCATTPTALDVLSDYTPVAVELTEPAAPEVVAGGASLDVAWDADELASDFGHVDVRYSTDGGETYPNLIAGSQAADGTHAWAVPEIDTSEAMIAATSVDANGNEAVATTPDVFAIDSSAPIVAVISPNSSDPYLPAGATTIRWTAVDATIDRVTDPITIEYSTNGETWTDINGGSYSKENDGAESWTIPEGLDYAVWIRVTAVDAADRSTTRSSATLIQGAGGYGVSQTGYVYGFGTANPVTNEGHIARYDWTRGIAVRKDGRGGYVLAANGYVFTFGLGEHAAPPRPKMPPLGGDRARGIVIRPGYVDKGYIIDAWGRVKPFGGAPSARYTTLSSARAKGIVMTPDGRGGYVLDAYGRLYPFAVYNYAMPKQLQTRMLFSSYRAVAVTLRSDGTSGYILDEDGFIHVFGGAPKRGSVGTSSTADARGIILMTDTSGFWVDGLGVVRPWGGASGPALKIMGSASRARGAAS